MPKQSLSVVINTKDSAQTLARTLKSVKFADEIVVVDAKSSDDTVKIAKQYTKQIYSMKGPSYVEPYRNFALSKASHPWVLVVDADEVISKALREKILKTINHPRATAYFIPRKNLIFGQWLTKAGWWPDYQLRLFKPAKVQWSDKIHSIPQVEGKTAHFKAEEGLAIVHYNYDHLDQFIGRLNNYTSIQAKEQAKSDPQATFSLEKLLSIFAGEFARRAMMYDGVEQGLHGTSLAFLQAFSEATVYLKQWEAVGFSVTKPEALDEVLNQLQRTWRYWWADYRFRHSKGLSKFYWLLRRRFKI